MNEASPRLWFLRPLETIGSIRAGFAIALALSAASAVAVSAGGDTSPLRSRLAVGFPIWIGYSLAFAPVVLARLIREVHELEGIERFSPKLQIAISAVGVAMHTLMATLSPAAAEGAYPPLIWLVLFESLLGWILTVPISIIFLRAIGRLRQLGRVADPNLLEATPLAPFGRAGTLLALYFSGIVVISTFLGAALRVVGLGLAPADAGQAPVAYRTFFTLLLVAAVYLPTSGARRAIRAAKRAELTRIAAKVGHHLEVLDAQGGPERASGLMTYRERIQSVREWPFAVGTAPRAILYIALPLLSWIAAALVERALGAFLSQG